MPPSQASLRQNPQMWTALFTPVLQLSRSQMFSSLDFSSVLCLTSIFSKDSDSQAEKRDTGQFAISNTPYLQNHIPKKQNVKNICFKHHDT